MATKVLMGLAGAPTVVVDASLHSCHQVLAGCCDVWGVTGGPDGLVDGRYAPMGKLGLRSSPRAGSALAGGRRVVTRPEIDLIVQRLGAFGFDALVLAGGNGTMALLHAIDEAAHSRHIPLQTIGIPKTIDNDLLGVDFSPGFGSAARYLALTIPDIARDHRAMSSVEPIRIVETMGRGVGWLATAGAAALAERDGDVAADLCLVPECATIDDSAIFAAVEAALKARSRAFIVCSEGFPFQDSDAVYRASNHDKLLLGGVARRLARALEAQFGRPSRGEVLGTQQRCSVAFASAADLRIARLTGGQAGRYLLEGRGGVMVGTHRQNDAPLVVEPHLVPLADVASSSRPLPKNYWPTNTQNLDSFNHWLRPIIFPGAP